MIALISVIVVFVGLLVLAMWKEIRPLLQTEHMFAVIINPDRTRTLYWAKPKDSSFSFKGDKQAYKFTSSTVYKTGRFKVGTVYFIRGRTPSVNFESLSLENVELAREYYTLRENRVAEQIVQTLDANPISPTMIMVVICIAIIGSVGFLYWKWNPRLEKIEEQTAQSVIRPVPSTYQYPPYEGDGFVSYDEWIDFEIWGR